MAFVSYRTGNFNDPLHIFVMNADGTGRRNLTADTALTYSSTPNWSPDGQKIAFTRGATSIKSRMMTFS